MTRELQAALGYAKRDMPVFPVSHDKTPLVTHGFHSASTDVDQVAAWWGDFPDAGIGWAINAGILVVDVDARHRGHESLAVLEAQHGPLPKTLTSVTGGGGLHLIFKVPVNAEVRQRNAIREGIDSRVGRRGYVILPPSQHASGKRYEWKDRIAPTLAPAWLIDLLNERPAAERSGSSPSGLTPARRKPSTKRR